MTKTIFITGGSRGIGEALVRKCAGNYNVAFTFNRSGERAKRLQDELNATYGGVFAVHCDVSDPQSVSDAAIAVKKRFGKIDILVNDAGIAKRALFIDTTLQDWRDMFAVNVDGVFNVTKAVLPDMLSRSSGSIVNV